MVLRIWWARVVVVVGGGGGCGVVVVCSRGTPPPPESRHDSGDILYSGLNDVFPAVARYSGKCTHVLLVLIAYITLLR